MSYASYITPLFDFGKWQTAYTVVSGIFMVLDALLVVGIIIALVKGSEYMPQFTANVGAGKRLITIKRAIYAEGWRSVLRKFSSGSPESVRIAIVEADALVDRLLRDIGFKGDTLAERLQKLDGEEVRSVSGVWDAHRLRNNLVHSPGFSLSSQEAETALKKYEAFFKELEIL